MFILVSTSLSDVGCPAIVFCKCFFNSVTTAFWIASCFSLCIFESVSESLHEIFDCKGVDIYSPIKTSICFLTSGTNSTEVGVPIP